MTHINDEKAKITTSEIKQDAFFTNENLLPCRFCGNRKVSGCSCSKKIPNVPKKMPYKFSCIYCKDFQIDYSMPTKADVAGYTGKTLTLDQGKEIKIVTFSNVEWKHYDKIMFHPSGSRYNEPSVHVKANEENSEFHGYNVSQMDEGVKYTIGGNDYFEIECNIDTSTIKPHPGGQFYFSLGLISANIDQNGGTVMMGNKVVARVGSKCKIRMIADSGSYEVYVDGNGHGKGTVQLTNKAEVVFGFRHNSHDCELLSRAYVTGIKMKHGASQQPDNDSDAKRQFWKFW